MEKAKRQPLAYVIIGFIGSGKTTFANKLEKETGALRFTKDEWVIAIFGHDPTFKGFDIYDNRISKLAVDVALYCLKAGNDIIIDEGFWVRSQRDEIREKIEKAGGRVQFYYVKNTHETMKLRISKRNQKPTSDAFVINQEMYDGYRKYFDEPSPEEKCIIVENVEEK
ncbi:ATP-binding protein [Candidatus Gottesmanbacteria bacterium]|nr:ATP-binding protein [Candidatus Gottesmanbacteria bacterium]